MSLKRFDNFTEKNIIKNDEKIDKIKDDFLPPTSEKRKKKVKEIPKKIEENVEDMQAKSDFYLMIEDLLKTYSVKELNEIIKPHIDGIVNSKIVEKIDQINENAQIKSLSLAQITLSELKDLHGKNEAVESVELSTDEQGEFIQFNCKCETDIQKTTNEYNGIRLKYQLLCDIPNKDIEEEKIIKEHKQQMDNLISDYVKEVKNDK